MSSSLLNVSGKIDRETSAIFAAVKAAADKLGIPFVVVGASARDIVLHHCFGANIQRATEDIDFAIQVPDWATFDELKGALFAKGFKPAKAEQRLVSPDGIRIDIVPFGRVEGEGSHIAWPPSGDSVMSVLGFREACDHAENIIFQEDPVMDIPVAMPDGMALLKLIAWLDRPADSRSKDAKDLGYLMRNYQKIPCIEDLLYADGVMEIYDWDISLAGSFQLAVDARSIAAGGTREVIMNFFEGDHARLDTECLAEEMSSRTSEDFERNEQLLNAFKDGFKRR